VLALDFRDVQVVLLDIEGTTTPLEFVQRTLFGYACEHLRSFLEAHRSDPEVRECVNALKAQHDLDEKEKLTPPAWPSANSESDIVSAARFGLWLIDRDSKAAPLKTLQGLIWQEGYRSGKLQGQVYPDVPRSFERWRQQCKEIAIYSSGSELAQRLLFSTTEFGDLTKYISNFFDTRVGAKASTDSYRRIALLIGCPENKFLFLSDAAAEIHAARSAGLQAALVLRESANSSDAVLQQEDAVIRSFDEVDK
jgi:enolase-phosphatase E1